MQDHLYASLATPRHGGVQLPHRHHLINKPPTLPLRCFTSPFPPVAVLIAEQRPLVTPIMEIDDILREVDPSTASTPLETRDLQALTRRWIAERTAPELLPWESEGLFERVNDRIKAQIEKIEDMTGDMDPKTNFTLIILQTELERFKFLVRSYLRARIAKVPRANRARQSSLHSLTCGCCRSTSIYSTTSRAKNCAPDSPQPNSHTLRATKPSFTTTTFLPSSHRSPKSYRTSMTRPEISA